MTEEQWIKCTSTSPMLEVAGRNSHRKLRLFACGCYRRLWARFPPVVTKWAILEASERHADGTAKKNELYQLRKQFPEERMAIGNAFDAAKVTSLYCINFVWDLIGGDNYLPSDYRRLYAPETPAHCDLIRDIFGNPFRPVVADPGWLTPTAVSIATAIYDDRAFDRLPILADALEEAGCTDADLLLHCREPGEHVRGCWAVDLVLGKS